MPLPPERPLDDAEIVAEPCPPDPWQPLPGASSDPGRSLCRAWLTMLAAAFLLALGVGLIGAALEGLWN